MRSSETAALWIIAVGIIRGRPLFPARAADPVCDGALPLARHRRLCQLDRPPVQVRTALLVAADRDRIDPGEFGDCGDDRFAQFGRVRRQCRRLPIPAEFEPAAQVHQMLGFSYLGAVSEAGRQPLRLCVRRRHARHGDHDLGQEGRRERGGVHRPDERGAPARFRRLSDRVRQLRQHALARKSRAVRAVLDVACARRA